MLPSPVTSTIDLDAAGRHTGFLHLPHSHDTSAYGAVMIPIASLKNGEGPTVILTGGNHGDEYQGPLAALRLLADIDVDDISGQLIVIPTMNQPAFAAAARTSPIDKGNLNRLFPGRPDGTVTQKIADYLTREILPRADAVIDVHDGGKTLEFVPMACIHVLGDTEEAKAQEAKAWAMTEAFGAPYSCRIVELDSIGMFDTQVEQMGIPFLTTEIGGGGTTRADWAEITLTGVQNVLRHLGILPGEPHQRTSQEVDVPEENGYVISETEGLIEWVVELGASISPGQVIARIHDPVRIGTPPLDCHATVEGILAMRHYPGLIKLGDAIAMQAVVL